ncbi:hypothetical protein bpuCAU1_001395 (plasmid) [Borrelia puertoricensis]|uniref:hypothetical protein n=1 Tax=Borrelia puertoricensis TaxID=2756107 RepID=UPI003EC02B27
MFGIKNIFSKINSKQLIPKSSTPNSLEINPKEIISFSKNYLLLSNSTELKSIGIVLSSGIPLASLNNKNFTITNFTDNTISYTLSSSGLQIKKFTLLNSKLITNAIYSLKKLNSTILPGKINRILKKLFLTNNISSKYLESIYYSILYSSHRKNIPFPFNSKTTKLTHNITLVSKTTPLNSYKNLKFIHSFLSLRLHNANLLFYKNSNNHLHSTIASLVESFFLDQTLNKNLHTLKSYINLHLKQLGIPYKSTNRFQKQLFSHIFL